MTKFRGKKQTTTNFDKQTKNILCFRWNPVGRTKRRPLKVQKAIIDAKSVFLRLLDRFWNVPLV